MKQKKVLSKEWKSLISFSKELIETEDIDPVYVFLYQGRKHKVLDEEMLYRWLFTYWCFYHSGLASQACDKAGSKYWSHIWSTLRIWPRGAERRHFRGSACENALQWLQAQFPDPADAIISFNKCKIFSQVKNRIQKWPLFGPWITFKAADMLERVVGRPIDFSDCELDFYKEPAAGAKIVEPEKSVGYVVDKLLRKLGKVDAPPSYDRTINIQEAESCLCKTKAYWNGHYYIGKDIKEVGHALTGWGPIAKRLKKWLPELPKGK